jgi:hypothetical protein
VTLTSQNRTCSKYCVCGVLSAALVIKDVLDCGAWHISAYLELAKNIRRTLLLMVSSACFNGSATETNWSLSNGLVMTMLQRAYQALEQAQPIRGVMKASWQGPTEIVPHLHLRQRFEGHQSSCCEVRIEA